MSNIIPEFSQDSKNLALLTWLGTIFFGFIPSLVVYLIKTDDSFVRDHSKEALNWSITAAIGYAIAWILTFILIGALLFPIIWLVNLVFCILGMVAASNGKTYLAPFAIRLVK